MATFRRGNYALRLTVRIPHGKMMAARESPSGKASAFQADIRGFESRLPLWFAGVPVSGGQVSRDTGTISLWTGPWRSG